MNRGYQPDFYTLNEWVRDPDGRQRKAEKIRWALESAASLSLNDAICVDVGCSSGIMTATLAQLFATTFGLEYDAVALQSIAPSHRAEVKFLRGDAMRMPFPDCSVDVVICAQVYEHVPNDERLFDEIYRILRQGGLVFFSGPNWLFPIEPHYFLPFLHWLPQQEADTYLRLTRRGKHYYERSRHYWALRHLLRRFEIEDISRDVLIHHVLQQHSAIKDVLSCLPAVAWPALLPLMPNFNWILRKPGG